jgi:hypothetical protein
MRRNPISKAGITFAGLCLICGLGLAWYYSRIAVSRTIKPASKSVEFAPSPLSLEESKVPISVLEKNVPGPVTKQQPSNSRKPAQRIFFRWTATDEHYGQLASVEHPSAGPPSFYKQFSCEVVHFASGTGVCLKADRGVFTRYWANLFDGEFRLTQSVPLNGIPSRTRVSPDGKLAAVTVFLTGHSYASIDFTTQTLLVQTSTGLVLVDLEQYAAEKDGQPFHAADFNYWGVTFTPDSRKFYCTLSTNRTHYLVEGDPGTRTVRVVHENVECPSLSPDASRIAYKKRLPGSRATWQLNVLNLATRREIPLTEKRSVDDQLEWLDPYYVLYSLPQNPDASGATTDVWITKADGTGVPRVLMPNAYSPAVVR